MKEDAILRYRDEEYELVFNFNVMAAIQDEYGTVGAWGALTDGQEPNAKAVIFGFTAMLNEGIDIDNEEKGLNRPHLTKRQVGRLLTDVGLLEATEQMRRTVMDSTGDDEKNA